MYVDNEVIRANFGVHYAAYAPYVIVNFLRFFRFKSVEFFQDDLGSTTRHASYDKLDGYPHGHAW